MKEDMIQIQLLNGYLIWMNKILFIEKIEKDFE